jgi:hypothetical protein
VQTIAGYCKDPVIVSGPEELEEWLSQGNNREKPFLWYLRQQESEIFLKVV